MSITPKEFDRLLELVMLNLNDDEYQMYFKQMDQIIGYMDKLKELNLGAKGERLKTKSEKLISLDRQYMTNTVGLSNVQHPIAGNMIQIKFKRG